jgi:pimeloyl-ACP methyl ester carboxylesterase
MQLCDLLRLRTIRFIANGFGLEPDGYTMESKPTLMMIPCFAGAPWQLDQLHHLQDWPMRTMRLPERLDDLEKLADFVLVQARDLEGYVLVGDSFGAVISIAAAVRQPRGLVGLVLSGGFAKNPITSPLLKGLAALAPFFPGPFYRQLTLRLHAANLKSRFDPEGEIPWSAKRTRGFFVKETPHRAYVNWVRAVGRAEYTSQLSRINVPTLILTPENDRLIGKEAAGALLGGIMGSREVVLSRTGHMFRFSHPGRYSEAVSKFLVSTMTAVGDAR